jgi:hypothetical protein
MDDVWAVLVASQDDSDCACHQTIHAPRFVADDVDGLVRRELLQTGSFQNGISEVRRHLAEPSFTKRQIMSRALVHYEGLKSARAANLEFETVVCKRKYGHGSKQEGRQQ